MSHKTHAYSRAALLAAVLLIALAACSPRPAGGPGAYPAQGEAGGGQLTPGETGYPAAGAVAAPSQPPAAGYPAAGSATFQVVRADGSPVDLSLASLGALPAVQVSVGEVSLSGPKLRDVLQAAGVTDFQVVTVTGQSGSVTLNRDQIGDETILAIGADQSISLADPNLPADQQINGVAGIRVE